MRLSLIITGLIVGIAGVLMIIFAWWTIICCFVGIALCILGAIMVLAGLVSGTPRRVVFVRPMPGQQFPGGSQPGGGQPSASQPERSRERSGHQAASEHVCPSCGASTTGTKFCTSCGRDLG